MSLLFKLTIAFFFISISTITYSQTTTSSYGESSISDLLLAKSLSKGQLDLKYDQIKGSPYYLDSFSTSNIYFKEGGVVHSISTRLNLFDCNLEFLRNSQYFILNNVENIDKIEINNEVFVLIHDDWEDIKRGFYKVRVDGDYYLLSSLRIRFKEAKVSTNSYSDDIPAEFAKVKEKFFLGYKNTKPIAIGNKKQFQAVFKQSDPDLVNYARGRKLNPGKYNDLVEIVNYMNSRSIKPIN